MSAASEISPPEKLSAEHDLSGFDSGEPVLDDWLRRRARQNEESGSSRTYVVCVGKRVGAYYTLAVGAIAHAEAPGRIRRSMPDPVPATLLGQLAVDREFQGQGHAASLLLFALLTALVASESIGSLGVMTHPLDDVVRGFYARWGFQDLPFDPRRAMFVRMVDLRTSFAE